MNTPTHFGNMAEVLEKAMEVALDKKDPKRKLERRLERERKGESKKEGEVKSRPGEISKKDSTNVICVNPNIDKSTITLRSFFVMQIGVLAMPVCIVHIISRQVLPPLCRGP